MIGAHVVTVTSDPDVEAWGPALNYNPEFAASVDGWHEDAYQEGPWIWSAGKALSPPNRTATRFGLVTDAAHVLVRPDAAQFRLRIVLTVPRAGTVTPSVYFGRTPNAASFGDYWYPGEAVTVGTWAWLPGPGTHAIEFLIDPHAVPPDYGYIGPNLGFWDWPVGDSLAIDSIGLAGQGVGVPVDVSCLIDEVTINHGRDDSDSQPSASSCTLGMSFDTETEELPDAVEVGSIVRVATTFGGISSSRFVGRITDVTVEWDDAGTETPDRPKVQVIATGVLSELGRRVIGDTPWPQQLDGARVASVLSAAGFALDAFTSDPGTVQILARDVDSQPALQVAQGTAESAGGMVWATKGGEVRYADADHRRGAQTSLTLDACDVLVTPTWRRTTEGLVNKVSIGYGLTPEGGEQPRFVSQRDDSIAAFGRFEFTTTTELAAQADAAAMGNLLLTRNRAPVWIMSALPVDVAGLDADRTAAFLALDMHSLLTLTGLPAVGTAPTSATLWVEGWRERLAFGVHDIDLVVSGYCRTAPAPRWDDVNPAWTWNDMPGSLTWDDVTCLGPPAQLGRWADVPASLRWDGVPSTVTWDTYEDWIGV